MLPETMFNLFSSPTVSNSVLSSSLIASRQPDAWLVEWKEIELKLFPVSQRLSSCVKVDLIRNASRWPEVAFRKLHLQDGQVKDGVQPVGTW